MNLQHLGDCMDYYKRWFLRDLLEISDVLGIPMFSDVWSPANAALYQRLVGVTIIEPRIVPGYQERSDYFRSATAAKHVTNDVFLDPDTGFRIKPKPPRGKPYNKYLFADEVCDELLPEGSTRLVIVYDQSIARGREEDEAKTKLYALLQRDLHGFAYSAQVAMIGISRSEERVKQVTAKIRKYDYIPQKRFQATHELN